MPKSLTTLQLNPAQMDTLFDHPTDRYSNRELSWLAFNARVMEEAQNPQVPLLERLKFLSISAGNLDEFYMVRVAGLKDQVHHGISALSTDGLTPKEQLALIEVQASRLMHQQQRCWLALKQELVEEGIHVVAPKQLSDRERAVLRLCFEETIFPLLTPIAVDPAHPFPFIPNLGIVMVFELHAGKRKKPMIALVPLPHAVPRFVRLEGARGTRFIQVEDVIALFLDTLFPGFACQSSALFRIIRDSDLEIEDEAEDLMRVFEAALKERRRGRVVRIKAQTGRHTAKPGHATSDGARLITFMLEHLPADPRDVIDVEGMAGLAQVSELYDLPRPDLKFPSFAIRYPERIYDYGGDCFAAIRAKDIVIHHPYESFDVVVQFLRQAAEDPSVVSIKQSLYRTSADSPIVKALIAAAEAGKSVTALVELKARFDEEANMRFARAMERAGVQVVYGFVDLKTHAKLSLIVRREEGVLKSYAHFGTGNYHPATARVYTDLSFFTCDPDLCHDAALLFNHITGYGKPRQFAKLMVAPQHMRKKLIGLIEAEVAHAQAGRPAAIWLKLNALTDAEIIDALYAASQAGVDIELVVRGVCCLKPGIPGFSDRIHVKSVIGRFLEHARIYCFGAGHGLPSPQAKVFIASADWMNRNFDSRVEVAVPIENPTVHAQVLDQIMVANLNDERQTWILQPDGSYTRLTPRADNHHVAFSAHEYFMHNPSLSGRGKALERAAMKQPDKDSQSKSAKKRPQMKPKPTPKKTS
jgi:polyphosphate kinase